MKVSNTYKILRSCGNCRYLDTYRKPNRTKMYFCTSDGKPRPDSRKGGILLPIACQMTDWAKGRIVEINGYCDRHKYKIVSTR